MCFRPGDLDIPKKCPACGHMNDQTEVFCVDCGAELPEAQDLSAMPAMPAAPGAPGAPSAPGAPGIPAAPGAPSAPGQPS